MVKLASVVSTGQALILGVVVMGCATAAVVTGHISGSDFMTVTGITLGAGGAVTAAHVGGVVANSSGAASAAPAPVAPAAPTVQAGATDPPSTLAVVPNRTV